MKPGDAALLDADMANWSTVEIVDVGDIYCKVKAMQSDTWEVMKNRLTVIVPSEVTELFPEIDTNDRSDIAV